MPRLGIALATAFLAAGLSGSAIAAEYCVTCEGPPALYRCVVDGTPEGPGTDSRASLHCISEMARQGQHERCAVSRGAPFPCPGLTALVQPQLGAEPPTGHATVPYPDPQPPAGTSPAHDIEGAEADTAEAPVEAPANRVPQTMEELAGQTVKSSKQGLEKAGKVVSQTGSAIGTAATNTWTCITSLFTSCGAPESEPLPPE